VETLSCRLLPYAQADGPYNMAADEVLLQAATQGLASLRWYGWSEATLSLGYFQRERVRHGDPRLAVLPYVRRPSGGAALVHHHELTYALALPAGRPWQSRDGSWLDHVHTLIAAALRELGVAADAARFRSSSDSINLLCFLQITPGDLVIGGDKVVGSAQRRQQGALLQHGAILIRSGPHAPMLPGICERTGYELAVAELSAAIERQIACQLRWHLVCSDWTAQERQAIEDLVKTRYGNDRWNRKR
jgi:lipoate-protein ligase A